MEAHGLFLHLDELYLCQSKSPLTHICSENSCQRITADILLRYDSSCWMYECLNYQKHHILRRVCKSHQRSDNEVQSHKLLLGAAHREREVKVFLRLSTLLINPESMLLHVISQLGRKSNLSLEFPPTPRPPLKASQFTAL